MATLRLVTRPLRIALLGAFLGGFALALWTEFPLCPMARSFGIPCPGCGLTRATLALLRGHVHEALHFHPLVWLLAPLFVGFMSSAAFDLVRDPQKPRRSLVHWNNRLITLAGTGVLVLTLGVTMCGLTALVFLPALLHMVGQRSKKVPGESSRADERRSA